MDFVRMRHGNAVWHRVTGREPFHFEGVETEYAPLLTSCAPGGYCFEGPRTELITAEHPPGRLCRVCAKGMEVAA